MVNSNSKKHLLQQYFAKKIVEEVDNYARNALDRYNQVVQLFLGASGVPYEEEVLVFDFLDLVGNVGGYLGLFLGASFLSLFDKVQRFLDRTFFSHMSKAFALGPRVRLR